MMDLTEELLNVLCLTVLGKDEFPFGEQTISFKRPWKRLKFMDALVDLQRPGPRPLRATRGDHQVSPTTLAPEKKPLTYGKALDIIFDKYVKEKIVQPTFLLNPPQEVSPLAKAARDNPGEAARFELFIAGMEIANAFSELTDPAEQKSTSNNRRRSRRRGMTSPTGSTWTMLRPSNTDFPHRGEGIGIDRLAMIFSNKRSIRDVILFPLLKPR